MPMRPQLVGCLLALLGAIAIETPMAAAATPSTESILNVMERVADWQLAHPSAHPLTDWTQGVGDTGFMALARIAKDGKYLVAMHNAGERVLWEPGPRLYDADDICVGQMYAEMYLLQRDKAELTPIQARLDNVLAHPTHVTDYTFAHGGKTARENWSWCDALFMGPPTWIRVYAATGDKRYLDFATKNWWRTYDFLYDRDEHLFYRDSTYFKKREANGKKIFWSRGNGWVMAGLARFIPYLPKESPERPRFEAVFQAMADKIAACQQSDGLWRASLLDPASYPLPETSGSSFYTFALAWGVNEGLLPRERFGPVIERAWKALTDCVESDGKLTHVQPIGADPKHFDPSSTEVYGVGGFLLAGSEIYRMGSHAP
jgi:rhamnogalacturonyl hydrolase YesR